MPVTSEPSLIQLAAFLDSPLVRSLLISHPNDIHEPHFSWNEWWKWSKINSRWKSISKYYYAWPRSSSISESLPNEIRGLIDALKVYELDRTPYPIPESPIRIHHKTTGMSPKKIHEVYRMTAYLQNLIESLNLTEGVRPCFVDVGAGQGYLTRALCDHFNTHVLALDADDFQTRGAESWERKLSTKSTKNQNEERWNEVGSITHRTLHVDATSLVEVIDCWVSGLPEKTPTTQVPIVLVALHACGSLTPDTLRAFLEVRRQRLGANNDASHEWQFAAAVVVGCCYNLLRVEDFPLSKNLATSPYTSLPPSAYHLATQIPAHWFDTDTSATSTALSVRKVVWRAILNRTLEGHNITGYDGPVTAGEHNGRGLTSEALTSFNRLGNGTITQRGPTQAKMDQDEGTGSNSFMRRLGRLPNTAYQDWGTFVHKTCERLGVDLPTQPPGFTQGPREAADMPSETQLETLHVLRCLLGPVIESLIVRDRVEWVMEELLDSSGRTELGSERMAARTVNIFDQSSGSGRNIAIVIAPAASIAHHQ